MKRGPTNVLRGFEARRNVWFMVLEVQQQEEMSN